MKHYNLLTELVIFLLCLNSRAQDPKPFLGVRFQFSNGMAVTWAGEPANAAPFGVEESYSGMQQSLQLAFFYPAPIVNVGLGGGISFRGGSYRQNLDSPRCPKVFGVVEIGNRYRLSLIITPGWMLGSVSGKGCFYIGGGPAIRIGKRDSDFNVFINPYVEYHTGEHKNGTVYDNRVGPPPGQRIDYTLDFKTVTVNLSCIIQRNFESRKK